MKLEIKTHTCDLDIPRSKSIQWRTCLNALKTLYTQSLLLDDLNHAYDTSKSGY